MEFVLNTEEVQAVAWLNRNSSWFGDSLEALAEPVAPEIGTRALRGVRPDALIVHRLRPPMPR